MSHSHTPFQGTTNIYAMSDTHQDTRKTCALLTQIMEEGNSNSLILNGGDIFKGIYPRDLERDVYIKLKKAHPDTQMVMTLGNNDFGFFKESVDYLAKTIKTFTANGIQTVCANIFEDTGKRPSWLKPYSIVEIDGDRTFVTGMCIDNINTARFGIIPKKSNEVIDELVDAINKEKPDNIVLLNHDYKDSSENLVKEFAKKGVNIDLVIGGHDHEKVDANTDLNIYYPQAFADSMYRMKLVNQNGEKSVEDVAEITNSSIVSEMFEEELTDYEKTTGLYENIAKSTLHLPKTYSAPCALGSFLADEIKEVADSDIAFFSTGFLMKPLNYKPNAYITNYDFQKTICADRPIKTATLSANEIKAVFSNALKTYNYGASNPKFLQCSNNVLIIGQDIPENECFEISQIFINGEPLLDKNGKALNNKKYKCAFDEYIANGGQGNVVLQASEQQIVVENGTPVKINEILMNGLKKAECLYEEGVEYPSFKILVI